MTDAVSLASLISFLETNKLGLILTIGLIILHFITLKYFFPLLASWVEKSGLTTSSLDAAKRAMKIVSLTTLFALLTFVWGFDTSGLMTVSASVIALLGVSLFAGWSILSNVTAFFFLIFQTSFRRGNYIRVINIDNYVEGYISDITLFHTKLTTEDRQTILYPNIQLLQNPSVINPRIRYSSVGKTTNFAASKNVLPDDPEAGD